MDHIFCIGWSCIRLIIYICLIIYFLILWSYIWTVSNHWQAKRCIQNQSSLPTISTRKKLFQIENRSIGVGESPEYKTIINDCSDSNQWQPKWIPNEPFCLTSLTKDLLQWIVHKNKLCQIMMSKSLFSGADFEAFCSMGDDANCEANQRFVSHLNPAQRLLFHGSWFRTLLVFDKGLP